MSNKTDLQKELQELKQQLAQLKQEKEEPGKNEESPDETPTGSEHILFVDDEIILMDL